MTLRGKTALVTGGGSGLGRAIVETLAREGANIVILSLSNPAVSTEVFNFASRDDLENVRRTVQALGREIAVIEGDSASANDLEAAVTETERIGPLDILVNNAGTNTIQTVVGHDERLWRRILDVNLTGPFLAIRTCLPGMISRNFGRIVSIASTNAHVGSAGFAAYCAAKHGLLGLHRTVALEVDGLDITVNTVSPGWMDTPSGHLHMRRLAELAGVSYDEFLAGELEKRPQRRLISPKEVAEVVAFLCGPSGRAIHGADVLVTGGASV